MNLSGVIKKTADRKASFADAADEMIKVTEETGQLDHAEIVRNNFF
jgi:hypothetical protein